MQSILQHMSQHFSKDKWIISVLIEEVTSFSSYCGIYQVINKPRACRDRARIQYGRSLCGVERAVGVLGIHANWWEKYMWKRWTPSKNVSFYRRVYLFSLTVSSNSELVMCSPTWNGELLITCKSGLLSGPLGTSVSSLSLTTGSWPLCKWQNLHPC